MSDNPSIVEIVTLACGACSTPPEDCGDDGNPNERYFCHKCEVWLRDDRKEP